MRSCLFYVLLICSLHCSTAAAQTRITLGANDVNSSSTQIRDSNGSVSGDRLGSGVSFRLGLTANTDSLSFRSNGAGVSGGAFSGLDNRDTNNSGDNESLTFRITQISGLAAGESLRFSGVELANGSGREMYSINSGRDQAFTSSPQTVSVNGTEFTVAATGNRRTRFRVSRVFVTKTSTGAVPPPSGGGGGGGSAGRPNVVVFYADDIGVGDISAYGFPNTRVSTPNIDALASQGMMFTDAHSGAALCAPSRYSLLTGNLPFRGSFFGGQFQAAGTSQVRTGQRTTGDLFKSAGYNTGFVGKVHMGGGFFETSSGDNDYLRGFRNGVDKFGFDYSFISHSGIQKAPYIYFENNRPIENLQFRRNQWSWSRATQDNSFAFTSSNFDGDPDNNGISGEVTFGSRRRPADGWDYWDSTKTGQVYTQAATDFLDRHAAGSSRQPFYLHYASQAVHIPHTPDREFFGQPVRGVTGVSNHLDMVHEMDLQVKAIVDKLTEHNLLDNTIFIFTSDNGGIRFSQSLGHQTSGIYNSRKGSLNEGGHRVPFIVRWGSRRNPVTPRGSICEELVSQKDMFATFANLLDSPQPASQGLDSLNVLPYFRGDFSTTIRTFNVVTRDRDTSTYSLTDGDFKIITLGTTSAPLRATEVIEMYNLSSDASERNNLFNQPAFRARRNEMLARLNQIISSRRSVPVQN